jgi:hypothetical protein
LSIPLKNKRVKKHFFSVGKPVTVTAAPHAGVALGSALGCPPKKPLGSHSPPEHHGCLSERGEETSVALLEILQQD